MASSLSDFVPIPETEFTPCAHMLFAMGYRVVFIGFEGVILPTPNDKHLKEYWTIERYTEDHRHAAVKLTQKYIRDDPLTWLVSLLSSGITVIIITEFNDALNGIPYRNKDQETHYIYQGPEWIREIMNYRLQPSVAQHLDIRYAKWDDIGEIMEDYDVKPKQTLMIHDDAAMIRKSRARHMGGMLVADHALGMQFH